MNGNNQKTTRHEEVPAAFAVKFQMRTVDLIFKSDMNRKESYITSSKSTSYIRVAPPGT